MSELMTIMQNRLEKVYEGGGKKAIARQKEKINSLPGSGSLTWPMKECHLWRSVHLQVMKCMRSREVARRAVLLPGSGM